MAGVNSKRGPRAPVEALDGDILQPDGVEWEEDGEVEEVEEDEFNVPEDGVELPHSVLPASSPAPAGARPRSYKDHKGRTIRQAAIQPRQWRYILLVTSGHTKAEAYAQAYGMDRAAKSVEQLSTAACKLEANPLVAEEIRTIREGQRKGLMHLGAGGQGKVERALWELYGTTDHPPTKAKSLELLGKAYGMFIERREVLTASVDATALRQRLAQRLETLLSLPDLSQQGQSEAKSEDDKS